MKVLSKIILVFSVFIGIFNHAQISIGGNHSVASESVLMDFEGLTDTDAPTDQETTNTKGLILPAVDDLVAFNNPNANNGTLIYNKNEKRVQLFQNNQWISLSIDVGDATSIIDSNSEDVGEGAVLGSSNTAAKGVLVLESNDKALVLPHIKNPHLSVYSPYPGMVCYDTVSNSLAVFDGKQWSYWR